MGKLLFRILFKCVTGAFERWEEFATAGRCRLTPS